MATTRNPELRAVAVAYLVTAACLGAPPNDALPRVETVPIPGATFTMGTPFQEGEPEYHDDEAPLTVTVPSFRIGKFPVTAREMCLFLNSAQASLHDRRTLYSHEDIGDYRDSTIGRTHDGKYAPREHADKAPANQVTWKGAVVYCLWLSQQTGKHYRLPSEAEWELAARGPQARRWPWGDGEPGPEHGERYDRARRSISWCTVPVGSRPANATKEGVHDMLAYVIGEWCANAYVAHPTTAEVTDPHADLDDLNSDRVVRGYYHRYYPRGGFLLRLTEYGWRSHLGRSWTRVGCDPIHEVNRGALWLPYRGGPGNAGRKVTAHPVAGGDVAPNRGIQPSNGLRGNSSGRSGTAAALSLSIRLSAFHLLIRILGRTEKRPSRETVLCICGGRLEKAGSIDRQTADRGLQSTRTITDFGIPPAKSVTCLQRVVGQCQKVVGGRS